MNAKPNRWGSAALLYALLQFAPCSAGIIETVAGTGQAADGADRGPALATNVGQPFGVEIGPDGALYLTEVQNHRVRRLDLRKGELTTVAGCGKRGYAGDGGPAQAALLDEPYEIRFDRQGHLYFVEMRNHVVRRVAAGTGTITTIAGTGQAGFSGDGGPATKATLRTPHSIALDGTGHLYIADIGNHRIRRVELAGGKIETVAGNGEKQLPVDGMVATGRPMLGPRALFIEGRTLWIALREGNSVWRMDLDTQVLRHVAGTGGKGYSGDGGPAKDATFNGPKGIAAGPDGRIYVVDTENQAIRQIDPARGTITTVAGSGPAARGYRGDGGPATQAWLARPHGVCVDSQGAVFIGDTESHRVRRFRP